MNVAEAIRAHLDNLELVHEEDLDRILADGSVNPKATTVACWYRIWREENFGPRCGIGLEKVRFYSIITFVTVIICLIEQMGISFNFTLIYR